MPKLNFYDTDAVKAFTLDVLVEGAETRRDLDFERRQSRRRNRGRYLHPVEPS